MDDGQKLGERFYSSNAEPVKWTFNFELQGRNGQQRSHIEFMDKYGLTRKLLAEVHFKAGLHQVYKFELRSLSVVFGYEKTSKWDQTQHKIRLGGHGHHSKIDFDTSDFTAEVLTNDTMMDIVMALLEVATKDSE